MKNKQIRVEAFVRVGEELKRVEELDPAQRERLGTWLKKEYLNELFRGRATFEEMK